MGSVSQPCLGNRGWYARGAEKTVPPANRPSFPNAEFLLELVSI